MDGSRDGSLLSCSSKHLYRSSVLVLLGLTVVLLSPIALLKRDIVLTVVNEYVQVSASAKEVAAGAVGTLAVERYQELSSLAAVNRAIDGETNPMIRGEQDCLPVDEESTMDGYFSVPLLETLGTWTSNKVIDVNRSISIVTQLSIDRLTMLENQCRSWDDVLVAVVYVPLEASVDSPGLSKSSRKAPKATRQRPFGIRSSLGDIERSIDAFFSMMEATENTCALQIQLVGQSIEDTRTSPYPINALRNRAIALAQTPLVFVLDVDFVAAPRLGLPGEGYRSAEVYDGLLKRAKNKGAIVVPAFELVDGHQMEPYIGEHVVKRLVQDGKDMLRQAYKQEIVGAFNARDFEAGHGPTNTSKWIRLRDPSAMYKVNYQASYEPFLILARDTVPHADERFVGYGANKLVFVQTLNASGFTFHVHGSGYAIHVPHAKTRAANIFIAHRKGSTMDPMDILRGMVSRALEDGSWKPVVRGCQVGATSDDAS